MRGEHAARHLDLEPALKSLATASYPQVRGASHRPLHMVTASATQVASLHAHDEAADAFECGLELRG